MKTMNNGTTAAKVNNSNESKNRVNNVAMPAGEYGDLCYDYFGKSSVIVFGNTDDHAAQLEAIGGKYSDRLKYSPLQNGRKWTEKQGRTAGYYFTTEQGKREAVQYVQRVNHAIFDRYEQSTEGGEHLRQKPADFKEGDRVRTIHGLGTVTAHEPQYNKAVSVCVRLDKMTYNYAWKGMPHTFIECRCDEITRYTPSEKSEAAHEEQKREFGQAFDAEYYKPILEAIEGRKVFHFGIPADTVRIEVKRECKGFYRIRMKRAAAEYVESMSEYIDWETVLNTDRAARLLSDYRADHRRAHRFGLGDLVRVNDPEWKQVNGHVGRITKMCLINQLVGTIYTVEFVGELPKYNDGQPMKDNDFEPLDIEPAA